MRYLVLFGRRVHTANACVVLPVRIESFLEGATGTVEINGQEITVYPVHTTNCSEWATSERDAAYLSHSRIPLAYPVPSVVVCPCCDIAYEVACLPDGLCLQCHLDQTGFVPGCFSFREEVLS